VKIFENKPLAPVSMATLPLGCGETQWYSNRESGATQGFTKSKRKKELL
jgi:hypothetical protein